MNLLSVQEFGPHFIYRKPNLFQMLMDPFFFLLNSITPILHIFWFFVDLIESSVEIFVEVYEPV